MNGLDSIINQLASTTVEDVKEVSFADRGLKLDTEEDAKEVVQAIKDCEGMNVLRLEGNTIGIQAAKAIAKALESQPAFNRALWRNMFTGRMVDEIPEALNYLSSGVTLANAKLVVLDLSDNAFGPRGLKGIVNLLKSPPCFSLRELQLNNNGLGISGAKMLASALIQCLENSRKDGKPLCLKVFVCGRNRLENEGSLALSVFLQQAGTLEHIAMPQNGIYHEGIAGLAEAFAENTGLRILNLEDNSLTEKGAASIASKLHILKDLETLNFGDCLIRTDGCKALAKALENSCPKLRELFLGFNEIKKDGGIAIAKAVENKASLECLVLNGNQFGENACQLIKDTMICANKGDKLSSLSEDEGSEDEDNEDYDEESENEDQKENADESEDKGNVESPITSCTTPVTFDDFVLSPSAEKLQRLNEDGADILSVLGANPSRNDYFSLFMTLGAIVKPDDEKIEEAAYRYTDDLLSTTFDACPEEEKWLLNNDFMVALHLIKGEGEKIVQKIDLTGVCTVLQHVVLQPYFYPSTKELLNIFFSKPLKYATVSSKVLNKLLQLLYQ